LLLRQPSSGPRSGPRLCRRKPKVAGTDWLFAMIVGTSGSRSCRAPLGRRIMVGHCYPGRRVAAQPPSAALGKRPPPHVRRPEGVAVSSWPPFDAGDGFESGVANVVDHSVVQRCLPPKMRPPWELDRSMNLGLWGLAFATAATRQRTTEWSATLPQRSFSSTGLTLATGSKAESPMSWITPWSNAACHQRCGHHGNLIDR
jgi:hypothetical protein